MTTERTAVEELDGVLTKVLKSVDNGAVLKSSPTLEQAIDAAVEKMMSDEIVADALMTRPEARAIVWRSPLGREFVSLGRGPIARLPFKEAIAKTDALSGGKWAAEVLVRFDAIAKGWTT